MKNELKTKFKKKNTILWVFISYGSYNIKNDWNLM